MDLLNRTTGVMFVSYGLPIAVRADDPAILERIRQHFPPGWKPSRSTRVGRTYAVIRGRSGPGRNAGRFTRLYCNADQLARSQAEQDVLSRFESDVQIYVAEMARGRVFVHAGVVGWKGKAIVIPGRSFSGKTTLVAELVRAGATYYSDEYAVFDAGGLVHPYARRLSMRAPSGMASFRCSASELGGTAGRAPLPVGLILATKYRTGARWRPRRLSAGGGALELLAHAVAARRYPERVLEALRDAAAPSVVLKGPRGEASQVVRSIVDGEISVNKNINKEDS